MPESPYFQRAPRVKSKLPAGKVVIHRPPNRPTPPQFSFESMVVPLIFTVVTIVMYYYISKKMGQNSTYMLFMFASSIPMVGSYVVTIMLYFRQKKNYRMQTEALQQKYLEQVQLHREELEEIRVHQARYLLERDPSPAVCMERIQERHSSLWERTPQGEDFLNLRIGLGKKPFQVDITVPEQDGYEVDPLIAAAQKAKEDYSHIEDVPVLLSLTKNRVVGLTGSREEVLNLVRTLTVQMVTHHAPSEMKLVALYDEEEKKEWEWMRWFPHVWNEHKDVRFLACGPRMIGQMLERLFPILNTRKIAHADSYDASEHSPLYVFFVSRLQHIEEDAIMPLLLQHERAVGACTFLLAERKEELPMECDWVVEVKQGRARIIETHSSEEKGFNQQASMCKVDVTPLSHCGKAARRMAPMRMRQSAAGAIPRVCTLFDLYNVSRVEDLQIAERWQENRYPQTLPVPIGVREGGKPVTLNIHDKIERNGHGPHGLMAGTTGSGKSEVIQSIIASLAITYHPHEVAFMLIDYKGGGMSNTFAGLPHVIGTITNLEDPNIIQRAQISLNAELERRQKLFVKSGVQDIDEYYKTEWRDKDPLPHLVIVIDEFAQLKKEEPEFMNELVSIAAIGRTLGVHLLLATQKPAGVVDEKIWTNSRFRICLRVQDDADSREMLDMTDASKITVPGRGYLMVGKKEILEFFQSAWSGAPYDPAEEEFTEDIELALVSIDGTREVKKRVKKTSEKKQKQLQVLIQHIKKVAHEQGITPLPGPWTEPLPAQIPLQDFYPSWNAEQWTREKKLLAPVIGLVDDVENQVQYTLPLHLTQGHLLVYGMPGKGKTTFLQTLMTSLILTHTPEEVHMYAIDFSRQLREYSAFPHVGGVVQDDEKEKLGRLFRFLLKEVHFRKEKFAAAGGTSLESYIRLTGESLPAIVVYIDGYLQFRTMFETENEQLGQLLREGAGYGVYFVITTNQGSDMYDRYRNLIPLAVSFELADPSEYYYAVGRPAFAGTNLPQGRGFVKGSLPPYMFQAILPYMGEEVEHLKKLRYLARHMHEVWDGKEAKAIPVLPTSFTLQDIEQQRGQMTVGLEAEELDIHSFALEDVGHVLVGGRMEGGKTSTLQTMILSLAQDRAPDELYVYLIDPNPKPNGLYAVSSLPHVRKFASDEVQMQEVFEELVKQMDEVKTQPFMQESGLQRPLTVLVIDDGDSFAQQISYSYEIKDYVERIAKFGRDKGVYIIMAATLSNLSNYSHEGWFAEFKKKYAGYLLGSTYSNDVYFYNIRIPHQETDQELPPGEGYFIKRKHIKVKTALPAASSEELARYVSQICERWGIAQNKV
ncbi:type VII secretion protein EssC [Ectobacillus sp. JY-23]|uniref:type VII secretion protein EssC n=1 Tax=Ectobacillus sp. JY-23 TaxID=2933872 RepID=UPI001FF18F18|nr:type VII secretion protein EssC [Ectobacillus sp. JY-23]UOY91680.1 type VII secretion protein EssC [Ectobacillus sp. JY-23]